MNTEARHLAICLLRRGSLFLVGEGYDRVKEQRFYRPLGGGIEAGESAEEAVVREIREELGELVRDVRYLGEIDNRFVYEGEARWEVVQVFEAELMSEGPLRVEAVEAEGWVLKWISIEDLDGPLYPAGLVELLENVASL